MAIVGVGHRLGGLGARLEQMRVLVGIGEDRGDGDIGAADLRGDVAPEILAGDDFYGIRERGRGEAGGEGARTEKAYNERMGISRG